MRGLTGAALLLRSRLKSHHAAPQTASSRDAAAGATDDCAARGLLQRTRQLRLAFHPPPARSACLSALAAAPVLLARTAKRESERQERRTGKAVGQRAEESQLVRQPVGVRRGPRSWGQSPHLSGTCIRRVESGRNAGVKCRLVSSHSVSTVRYHSGSKGAGKKSFGPASGTGKRRGDRFLRTEIRGKRQDRRLCVKAHPAGAFSCRSFLQTVRRKKAEVGRLYGGRVGSGRVLALRSASVYGAGAARDLQKNSRGASMRKSVRFCSAKMHTAPRGSR